MQIIKTKTVTLRSIQKDTWFIFHQLLLRSVKTKLVLDRAPFLSFSQTSDVFIEATAVIILLCENPLYHTIDYYSSQVKLK